ncbi:MAG: matrixin family metalloprotease [Planctomycetota bacterium]
MGFRNLVSGLFTGVRKFGERRRLAPAPRLQIEQLEDRVVLYAVSGNAWPNPQVITISFVPDGTDIGGVTSNLNAMFSTNPNLANWKDEVLRAAQSWAQATNINFVLVPDNGAPIISGNYQQGNPNFGDIRISGYDFGNSSLAEAFYPPPGINFSPAGDIAFNTSYSYIFDSGFDLYTIAVHEIGHALGLDHSMDYSSQMYPYYTNAKPGLLADDVAGIRNIYSANAARAVDDYDKTTPNGTFATADNITAELVRTKKWAIITDLDITTISDVDYYKVKIPAYAGNTLTVRVQSSGLSMLNQKVTLYAENQTTVLGTATGLGQYGSTLTLSTSGISTGDWFYIKVEGATSSAFGTGAYGLSLDIGATTTPVIPLPNTMKLNGNPLQAGLSAADSYEPITNTDTVAPAAPTIAVNIAGPRKVSLVGTAEAGSLITIFQDGVAIGTATTDSSGNWAYKLPRKLARGSYQFIAAASDEAGNWSLPSALQIVAIRTRNR